MSKTNLNFYDKTDTDFSKSIAFLLFKNTLMLGRLADLYLAPIDLTSSQMRILMMIGYGACNQVSMISKKLGSNAAGVVRTLDRLEEKQWIKRTRSEVDRREVLLELTPTGMELIKKIPGSLSELLNDSLMGFTNEEFELMKNLLDRMIINNLALLQEIELKVA
ncbi:MAG: MarR family transcriptional regulator [Betaproteobacteria bacterium]|jgi:DNA-binding MarR family transcriptional regulator